MPLSSQQSCDLSTILEIWPDHDHQCAGIAKGAGRRCKLTTNQLNRSIARSLLQEGSALLNSGEQSINNILTELAPRTLCVRWHQYQASGLVSQWARKVDKFVQQRRAALASESRERQSFSPRQSTPETRTGSRPTPIQIQQNNIFLNVESLSFFSNMPTPQATPPPANTFQTSRTARPSIITIPSVRSGNFQAAPSITAPRPSRMIENPVTPRFRPAETTERVNTENTQRHILPLPSRRTSNTATRRPIEGDCGICYLPLVDDDEDDTHSSDGLVSNSEARSSTSTRPTREPLVWCKAQCGHNYHKSCVDPWVTCCVDNSRAATCPTCRATWRQ